MVHMCISSMFTDTAASGGTLKATQPLLGTLRWARVLMMFVFCGLAWQTSMKPSHASRMAADGTLGCWFMTAGARPTSRQSTSPKRTPAPNKADTRRKSLSLPHLAAGPRRAARPVATTPCRMRRCGPRLPPSHGMREPPLTWATVAGRGGRRQRQRTAAGVRPRRPGFSLR